MGREHFCQSHHASTCAAAPVYDPGGNIIGCIDISGPLDSNHLSTLSLAVNTVKKIENTLYKEQSSEIINQSNALLSTVFNSVLTGLLSVDRQGRIRHANPAACALLEQPEETLMGRGAEELFSFHQFINLLNTAPEQAHAQGVPLQCRSNASFLARAHPVSGRGGKLTGAVITILEKQRPCTRPPVLPANNGPQFTLDRIAGQSESMMNAIQKARMAAQSPSTVLLIGASGTGKEMFAQGIHNAGPRASRPFSALNCGALSGELIQSELFGYVDGAFTGARRGGKPGRFEAAEGGTLFLDEIGEMPIAMQVNLLRVLEERKVVRIGGTKPVPVDVRIIAATNRNLADEVEKGTFRRDLYYRLKVVTISIPPLKEREGDVPLLARKLIPDIAGRVGKTVSAIHPDVYVCLNSHSWPGNVRELINALEYAVNIMPTSELLPEHLPDEIAAYLHDEKGAPPNFSLESMEAETIRKALVFHEGNITCVARALGIGRNTLYNKMKRYGIG
jgi:transcriptional regulator with PAS, ATPase and Fis domain